MRPVVLLLILLVAGCDKFPDSTFLVSPGSTIPGLQSVSELEGVPNPTIEIWLYAPDRAVAKAFNGTQLVVEVPGTWRWGTATEAPAQFFVKINDIETGFSRKGQNQVVDVVPATGPATD